MIPVVLIAAALAATPAGKPAAHATYIRADEDDDVTQKFADALRKALPHARHMRPETGDDADDLYLAILFALKPQGKRYAYAIDLMKTHQYLSPDRLASLTGTCKADAFDACARDVIAKADRKVGDDAP